MQAAETAQWKRPVVGLVIGLAVVLAVLSRPFEVFVARVYYVQQDVQAGLALLALLVLTLLWRPALALPARYPSTSTILLVSVAYAAALWLGAHELMFNYALTRDELMVEFDRTVFSGGRLSLPLPPEWRGYVDALVPAFLLDVPGNALLISAYGPVNAAMRAGLGSVADPALLNPLLAAIGLVLMHRIARHLFPDCAGAQWLAIGGYLLSAQIAVNAMTSYAMTGHLTFNLAWLALFLRNRGWSHAAAMLVGTVAIGLHQVIFHPLFAGPFILLLLAQRRRALFMMYVVVYAAALAFWFSWPQLIVASSGIIAESGSAAGGPAFLLERVVPLLLERDPFTLPLMQYNLLRMMVWNPAFLVPFMLLAIPAMRRCEGVALPLAGGVALAVVAMAILLPYQGHGWGYRYVHGLLGSCLLLAGYGYREMMATEHRNVDRLAVMLSLGTVPIVAWLLMTTHQFVQPYKRLSELIAAKGSDFVIVDTEPPATAIDQVRNRPDFRNRPLIFASHLLTQEQIRELCARGTISLIERHDFLAVHLGDGTLRPESPRFDQRTAVLRGLDCVRDGRNKA